MKRYLLILLIIAASFSKVPAQITLASSDFSNGGDTFRVSLAFPFTGMDATLTGANYSWDYSELVNVSQEIDTFYSVGSLPFPLPLVFGSSCNQATYTSTSFLGTIGVPIAGTYNMLNKNSGYLLQRGIGLVTTGGIAPVALNPADIIYKFPMQYGNVDSSNSGYVVNQIPGMYYSTARKRINEVDGWGTLTTPYGTFAVLRLKSVIQQHDSITYDTLNIGYDLPEQIEYKWIAQGKGIPVLQVTTSAGIPTGIVYRDSARMLINVPELTSLPFSFDIYPNPTAGNIVVHYQTDKASNTYFDVINSEGAIVYSERMASHVGAEQFHAIDFKHPLSAGQYFLRMINDGLTVSKPFVVTGSSN
jgi:hypothetical protein